MKSGIETRIRLSPVTKDDAAACARLFLLAFQADEYRPALSPHRVGLSTVELLSREGAPEESRLLRALVAKNTYMIKASIRIPDATGNELETIVGWAKWTVPPGFRRRSILEWLWSETVYPLQKFLFRPAIAPGLPDAAKALFVSQHMDTFGPGGIAEGEKHWYLHILCVDPVWQGAGIGGTLLRWGMDKAKEMDAAVYLDSSAAGCPFYTAKGFRVSSERLGEVNGISVKIPGMIWKPKWAGQP